MSSPTHDLEPCPGCGAVLPRSDGPAHEYIGASPACWAVYGTVLAKEYENADYWPVHGYTVDAYAAQHPGENARRQRQSVALHLVALCLAFEHGLDARELVRARGALADLRRDWPWLDPPSPTGWRLTVHDVARAAGATEHRALVLAWGRIGLEGVGPSPRHGPRMGRATTLRIIDTRPFGVVRTAPGGSFGATNLRTPTPRHAYRT